MSWRAVAVLAAALAPTAILSWLLANPPLNRLLEVPVEHFVLTTNVSVVAVGAGALVARAALQVRHFGMLLLALGFITMAGIFSVHGLSTPGVLQRGVLFVDAGLVVGVSAQLSLLVPAMFFALRYTPLVERIERRIAPGPLLGATLVALAIYAVLGLAVPAWFDGLARVLLVSAGAAGDGSGYGNFYQPVADDTWKGLGFLPYVAVGLTVSLYSFAAWRQGVEFVRSRLPLQGALVIAYVLLAQAQISQFLGPVWTLSWWQYHGLMLTAVALAVGAIFVELDRRRGLERFLPPSVVERIIKGDARLDGERRMATILFADLRGSTALVEQLAPDQSVALLNSYVGPMARAVIDQGGIIDKYLGDGLMAIFLPTDDDPSAGADAATTAALEIRQSLADLNSERKRVGKPALGFGVGIDVGEVIVGAVGIPERSDYTALGDAVNTAARLESLCKEFSVDIVVSADVAARLTNGSTRSLGPAKVRGKSESVIVHALL